MKKLLIILLLPILYALFSYRTVFFTPHDVSYVRDLYDHSQWRLATSLRSVSDEILYQVAGYDQIKTGQLFTIAPEVPPLGKYLYGAAIVLWNNPYVVTIPLYLFTLLFFFLISREVLKEKKQQIIALLLFILDPLIISQLRQTMMDLPQLLAILIHVYVMILFLRSKPAWKKDITLSLIAGLALGAFISLKIGFFAVFIFLIDIFFMMKKRKLFYCSSLAIGLMIPFLASHTVFFLSGHSLVDFMRTQKWVLMFYITSRASPVRSAALMSLVFGFIKGWDPKDVWHRFGEWSFVWPIITIGTVKYGYQQYLKGKRVGSTIYLLAITVGLFISFLLVPFFVRYLLLVLPFFMIFSVAFFTPLIEKKPQLFRLVFFFLIIQFYLFLNPGPRVSLAGLQDIWQKGLYQDMYSSLYPQSVHGYSRKEFWRYMQSQEHKAKVEKREVRLTLPNTLPWQQEAEGLVEAVYTTPVGDLYNKQPVHLIKKENAWFVEWNDELLVSGFTPKSSLKLSLEPGTYGHIRLKDGTILGAEGLWPFLSVVPERVTDEQKMQDQLTFLTGLKKNELELKYKANNQPDWPAEIGFMRKDLTTKKLNALRLNPAITVSYRPTLMYYPNASKRYPVGKIDQIAKDNEQRLRPVTGGVLRLIKPGSRDSILLKRETQNGQDVTP